MEVIGLYQKERMLTGASAAEPPDMGTFMIIDDQRVKKKRVFESERRRRDKSCR